MLQIAAARPSNARAMMALLSPVALLPMLLAAPAPAATAPVVVVTSKPVHSLVASVMAGVGTPSLLVEGNASPHTYQLRPSQARELQRAELFVRVGGSVEPFSNDLIRVLPARAKVLTLDDAAGVATLALRTGAAFAPAGETHQHYHDADEAREHDDPEHEHEHEHDHVLGEHAHALQDGARDGHIWLDPANAKAIVADVAAVLADIDAANADRYRANAGELEQRLDRLAHELANELAPVKAKPFVVLHDATQYFERSFALTAVGAIQLSPAIQPGAKRLAAVRARIRELGAVCVFSEPWSRSHIVETAVEGTGAKTGTIDPEAIALAPGPDLYFTLMHELASSMRRCLE